SRRGDQLASVAAQRVRWSHTARSGPVRSRCARSRSADRPAGAWGLHVISGWRLYQRRFAANAFTGEGARLFGGRWNSPGTPMIYTASTPALAALEMLVHLDRADLLRQYRLREVQFEERHVERIDIAKLPKNWRRASGGASLRRVGDRWAAEARSLVFAVPSA